MYSGRKRKKNGFEEKIQEKKEKKKEILWLYIFDKILFENGWSGVIVEKEKIFSFLINWLDG